jgi:membrane protein implicated in regulation of membrane protease activity
VADEDLWRRRFYIFMGIRLLGVIVFLAGFAIAFSDWVQPGGWPAVGAVVIILGVFDAVAAPRLLRKRWREEDRGTADE